MECCRLLHFLLGRHPIDLRLVTQSLSNIFLWWKGSASYAVLGRVYVFINDLLTIISSHMQTQPFPLIHRLSISVTLIKEIIIEISAVTITQSQDFERNFNSINQVLLSYIKSSLVKIKECKRKKVRRWREH